MKSQYLWAAVWGITVLCSSPCSADKASSTKVPPFRFFKMSAESGVSLVVPEKATEAEIRALLYFIREKVKTKKFSDLGILHPTSKNFNQLNYDHGMILVFRGEKCANEEFIDTVGPCGYGEHDAGSYQWGLLQPGPWDGADVRLKSGDVQKVF